MEFLNDEDDRSHRASAVMRQKTCKDAMRELRHCDGEKESGKAPHLSENSCKLSQPIRLCCRCAVESVSLLVGFSSCRYEVGLAGGAASVERGLLRGIMVLEMTRIQ